MLYLLVSVFLGCTQNLSLRCAPVTIIRGQARFFIALLVLVRANYHQGAE